MWSVEGTNEFAVWFGALAEDARIAIDYTVDLLIEHGPALRFPHSSAINGSRHAHMRELRIQFRGQPLRILYAFDPLRSAILLIGGDKTGDGRFYERLLPVADKLYDVHIVELRQEGLLK